MNEVLFNRLCATLPERYREVLILRRVHKLPYKRISAALHHHMHYGYYTCRRAERALQQAYEDYIHADVAALKLPAELTQCLYENGIRQVSQLKFPMFALKGIGPARAKQVERAYQAYFD